jgi:abortive infection bacteriophage resistance protein
VNPGASIYQNDINKMKMLDAMSNKTTKRDADQIFSFINILKMMIKFIKDTNSS